MKKSKKLFTLLIALSLIFFFVLDGTSYAAEPEYVSINEYISQMTKLYDKYGFEYYYINNSGTEKVLASYLEQRLFEDEACLSEIQASENNDSNAKAASVTSLSQTGTRATAPYNKTFNVTGTIKDPLSKGWADIVVSTNLTLNAQYEDIISVNSITSHQEGRYKNFKNYTHYDGDYSYVSVYELEVTVTGWVEFEWQVTDSLGTGTDTEGYRGYRSVSVTVETK